MRARAVPDTRTRLIEVAERLFAEHGIETVSLRMVGAEAGQRNNSAAQYHFGSRDGLIEAIIATRSAPIDARRRELVGALQSGPEPASLPSLVNLFVAPLAETITSSGRRTWYLRFLANALDHPMLAGPWQQIRPHPPALRHMHAELRKLLPGLSDEAFERRSRWVAMITLRVLADHERQVSEATGADTEQVVAELLATLTALLRAP